MKLSLRKFLKIRKEKFIKLFKKQEKLKRKILLILTDLTANYVIEDHVQE